MSKNVKIIVGIVASLLIIGVAGFFIWSALQDKHVITEDSLAFKAEYEALNETTNDNNGKTYLTVELAEYNPMKYSSYEEVFEVLESGTGVIYFGFPTCPWCRNLVPVLSDSAIEYGIEEILYLNIVDDRDTKVLNKKGKVTTSKEGTEDYTKLVEVLYDFLPVYSGLKDEKIKRVYLPTIVFVKDGEVLGIEQSLSSFAERIDDAYEPMNAEEKAELAAVFTKYYEKIKKK